jgi:hypothetical protein
VSTRTVAAWESGKTTPRSRHARALAKALGVPSESLTLPGSTPEQDAQ